LYLSGKHVFILQKGAERYKRMIDFISFWYDKIDQGGCQTMKKILIIGGVAGGATAAARLRRLDEHAEIIMFEKGEHISYANCGLPYYISGTIRNREALLLQTPESFRARFNIDVRISSEVLSIDRSEKTVLVLNRVSGESYKESYDKLILATGGVPVKPPALDVDSERVFFLRDVADVDHIKGYIEKNNIHNAAVVGGGFIGIETAENLKEAGLDVSIIELSDQVIAPLDIDIACDLHHHIKSKGVKLYLRSEVQKVIVKDNGLALKLQDDVLDVDIMLIAIGVKPENRLAKEAGLEIGERGGVITDKNMRTKDPDIFAVGDSVEVSDLVTGQPAMIPLAGPANKQARIAADNICGITSEYSGTQGSMVIKVFDMTAAATGISEKTAKRLDLNYDKIFLFRLGHANYYPGSRNMSVKVIFEKGSGRILGAQAVGFDGVDKRCDVLAVAIRAGMTAHDLTELELCYAPPYSSAKDNVNMAGYMIENTITGRVKNFHWHDVDALPRDGSISLVDVREPFEFEKGSIDGFINIPLDALRKHIPELDSALPVYVNCQSGLRSYLASCILSQNGFDVYNLSGGYRLYNAVRGGE
jgi:NADPH-dependent 2,4-dienoyl-CoA reductase/sulfur reductase-like enzyme/rhodanese-related sulfurtransferase